MADDNPFASLSAPADDYSSPPLADPAADPFASLANPNIPKVASESPTTTLDLIKHPILSTEALVDYGRQRAADALQHHSSVGGLAGMAGDALQQAQDADYAARTGLADPAGYAAAEHARRIADERAAAPRPAGSVPEQVAGFLGDVGGTLLTPESMAALPEKAISVAGRPIVSAIARHAAGGALGNTAADLAAQATQTERGYQEAFNPFEALMAPIEGAVAGATLGAAGHGVKFTGDVLHAMGGDPFHELATGHAAPGTEPTDLESGAPATVANLWPRLLGQEHGTDKEGNNLTSPAGARGPAQLMPDTAAHVAQQLGHPEWAQIALGDGPMSQTANEVLGKTYLGQQLDAFGGDPVAALAAYNAGPGKVREWIARFGTPSQVGRERWLSMIPYEETRNYVHNILEGVVGKPHALTPEEEAFVQERTAAVPDQPDTQPASPFEAAQAAIDEAQPAPAPEDIFPGDRQAQPTATSDEIPWDAETPGEKTPIPSPKEISEAPDLTEQALDQIRSGKPVRLGEGPSLIEGLVKQGGVRDEGGELTDILGGQGDDRLLKMLRRVNGGMTLEDAAHWAQKERYIGDPLGTQDIHGGEPVTPEHLLDALRREAAGEKVYPADAVNHQGRQLLDHMSDLDELMGHVGVGTDTHTNAQIRDAIDQWYNRPDEYSRNPFEPEPGEILGMGARAVHPADEAIAKAVADRILMRQEIHAAGMRGLLGEQYRDAVPMDAVGAPEVVPSLGTIWRNLRDAFAAPVRQGRLSMRNALGTYNQKSGVVRVKSIHDVLTLTHELAHALEFTKKPPTLERAMKAYAGELKPLDYDPAQARRHEGFAEFVRLYVTNPAEAKARAPGFYPAFETAMAADEPRLLEALQEARQGYGDYMKAPSLLATAHSIARRAQPNLMARVLGHIQAGDLGQAVGAHWQALKDEVYRGLVDRLHTWQLAENELLKIAKRNGRQIDLKAADSPTTLLRQVPAVYGVGHADLINGVHPYHQLTPDSSSFAGAMELALGHGKWDMAKGALPDQFDSYLIARRVRHDFEPNRPEGAAEPPPGTTLEHWDQIVADAEAAHPTWKQAAAMIYDYNHALFRKMRDSGLITEEQWRKAVEDNPDYVPLHRDLRDIQDTPGGMRGRNTKSAGGLRRRRGTSWADYMSPTESIMMHTYQMNARIAHNDALGKLLALAKMAGPDAGGIAERLSTTEAKPLTIGIEEAIAAAAKKEGVSDTDMMMVRQALGDVFGEDADGNLEGSGTIFRRKDAPEGGPTLYHWANGQPSQVRLPDGLWGRQMIEAFSGMTPEMGGAMFDMLRAVGRIQRAATVLHPSFGLITNPLRDQFTVPFTSGDVGYVPGVDMARGIKHELAGDEVARRYAVVGGHMGGMQTAAERTARLKADINVLRTKGVKARYFANWEALSRAMELTETGSRLGVFEKGEQRFLKEGMSEWEASVQAGAGARDTQDFDRRGAWPGVRALARLVPFMNAGIQGVDKVRRVGAKLGNPFTPAASAKEQAEKNDAMKLLIGMSALAVGGLSLRAAFGNNPLYDEAAAYMRNTAWVIPIGGNYVALVVKPFDVSAPANAAERIYEGTHLKDPQAWWHLAQGLATSVMPNVVPTALDLYSGVVSGKDSQGAAIVPPATAKMDPQFQYDDRTSRFAKAVGKATAGLHSANNDVDLRQSPAKLDFLLRDLFSSVGRDAINATNAAHTAPIEMSPADIPILSRIIKDVTRGANSTRQFYDLMSGEHGDWQQGVASTQGLLKGGDPAAASKYLAAMPPEKRAYVMLELAGSTQERMMHPLNRAQAVGNAMMGMAVHLQEGNPSVVENGKLVEVQLTPHERRVAVDSLRMMAVAEQRNAMIAAKVPQWADKQPLPYEQAANTLTHTAPKVAQALNQIIAISEPSLVVGGRAPHLMTAAESYGAWNHAQPIVLGYDPARFTQALEAKEQASRAGATRILEHPTPAP